MRKAKTRLKQGKITPNGIRPEPHEMDTVLFFTNHGKNIELIPPSQTPNSKNADFIMDGLVWEAKNPTRNTARAIERLFYEASRQSENLIFDLRRIRANSLCITTIMKCFENTRRVRRLYIIVANGDLRYFSKK